MVKVIAFSFIALLSNIFIFLISRIVLSASFSQNNQIGEILLYGIGSDLRVLCPALAPFVLLILLGFFWELLLTKELNFLKYLRKFFIIYASALCFISLLVALCNYYYFGSFNARFSAQVFELFNDETAVLLAYIYEQYPVITLLLFAIIFCFLFYCFFAWVSEKILLFSAKTNRFGILIIFVIFVFCFVWGARGFDTFPRQSRFTYHFSSSLMANEISVNPIMALSWANSENKERIKFEPLNKEQKELLNSLKPELFKSTKQNSLLEKEPPNVLFVLLESFGSNILFDATSAKIDVLGEFGAHFGSGLSGSGFKFFENYTSKAKANDDFVQFSFLRFLGNNGTMPALQEVLLGAKTAIYPNNKALKYSSIDIYKKAGYKTIFVTNGSRAWKEIHAILSKQGIDALYDAQDILSVFKDAKKQGYGVGDEFLYKMITKILKEHKESGEKKPLFIFALSTENHPPFYAPLREFEGDISSIEPKINIDTYEVLSSYYKASDEFGKFISGIKADFSNLIIGASGDHLVRSIVYSGELLHDVGVPFYLLVPKKYWNSKTEKKQALLSSGSLKDIMPTLYNLSLSNATYLGIGRDLFGENKCQIGAEHGSYISKNAIFYGKNKIKAWKDGLFNGKEITASKDELECIKKIELLDELSFRARLFDELD